MPTIEPTTAAAETIYGQLRNAGLETLYDDRDERGGVKLGSMDVIGLPWQVIVGPRGIAAGTVELKRRSTGEREELSIESALARLNSMKFLLVIPAQAGIPLHLCSHSNKQRDPRLRGGDGLREPS